MEPFFVWIGAILVSFAVIGLASKYESRAKPPDAIEKFLVEVTSSIKDGSCVATEYDKTRPDWMSTVYSIIVGESIVFVILKRDQGIQVQLAKAIKCTPQILGVTYSTAKALLDACTLPSFEKLTEILLEQSLQHKQKQLDDLIKRKNSP